MVKVIRDIFKNSLVTAFLVITATALGSLFVNWEFQETNIVITYILSVLLVSRFTDGYTYGILAAISSLLLFNWFFTAPYFTLKVNDPTYMITFVIMTITSIITSALTTKVKKAAIIAKKNEEESNALYKMTNLLTDCEDSGAIANVAVNTISRILSCDAAFICCDEDGNLKHSFIQQKGHLQIQRELDHGDDLKQRLEMLHTAYDDDGEYYNYPVYGKTMILGILRIPGETASELDNSQIRTVYSVIESTALALERLRSLRQEAKSHEEAVQEHYRGNLLRAISHDIRTPLSGIMGSVEMLMDMIPEDDMRHDIAAGVYQDADWLHSLVENILNLTKLHDGHLNIAKQQEAVEEVIASSVMVMEKRFPDRVIDVSIPDDLVMIPMDAKLISQVLINLMDNAVKHTPADKEIRLEVNVHKENIEFIVADRGSGINETDLPNIFQMFYTTRGKSSDSQRGIGLGLTICQSIVEAHGGSICAHNREGGGAEFIFTLPVREEK